MMINFKWEIGIELENEKNYIHKEYSISLFITLNNTVFFWVQFGRWTQKACVGRSVEFVVFVNVRFARFNFKLN